MKFKLAINNLILLLPVIVVLIVVFKISPCGSKNERKQEISAVGISTNSIKEINITAKQFSFSPNPIKLKLNERVKLKITSTDVIHGFSAPELNIDEVISPGKETIIDFTPSKKGTFTLLCSITCGTGHSGMRGNIIIE